MSFVSEKNQSKPPSNQSNTILTAAKSTVLFIRQLGITNFNDTFTEMRSFTDNRNTNTIDELWMTEHHPVFTQGLAGKSEHILMPGNIPIVQTDRGGQVTYHGPGQCVFYILIDLKRKSLTIRDLVCSLEKSTIALLSDYKIKSHTKSHAPGVYTVDKKIASIGLRIRRHCSYHGLSLNVNMDLEPFTRINPCGFSQLKMSQMSDFILSEYDNDNKTNTNITSTTTTTNTNITSTTTTNNNNNNKILIDLTQNMDLNTISLHWIAHFASIMKYNILHSN